MQRLVVNPSQIEGTTLTLTVVQQHYLQRVLRLREGAQFIALDGTGQQWQAVLTAANDTATLLAPMATSTEPPMDITLAAALPKQGFDQVVRQVTELGVSRIVPILSDRTLLRPSDHKVQRWQRIATEAAEQCERTQVPIVLAPAFWADWLDLSEGSGQRLIAVARGNHPPLLSVGAESLQLEIAIGPEGGWTEAEISAALAAGYQPVSLGRRILRTLTASVAALAVIQAAHGEQNPS